MNSTLRGVTMKIDHDVREGVRSSLPELDWIQDTKLREKVVDAWALSLAKNGFRRIEDIPASGNPSTPLMKRGTQADHLRGVARIALRMAEELEQLLGPLDINSDMLIAAGLCHDVGKPFEFSEANQTRWKSDHRSGLPALRHTLFGAHVALTVELPEEIAHVAGCHSMEGQFVRKSVIDTIIHHADYAFWDILDRGGVLEPQKPQ